jgi:hypothetical protein
MRRALGAEERRTFGAALGAFALALAVTLLLIRFFSPSWIAFWAWARVPDVFSNGVLVRRGVHVTAQVADPFAEIPDRVHKVVRWRLLFPILGHYLGLPPGVVLALSHL